VRTVRRLAARALAADARVMTLYEGTSQIQQLIIGRALTGIDAIS
jgi:alkylation response protein AidB-like acyl-CoA dehydrogenase